MHRRLQGHDPLHPDATPHGDVLGGDELESLAVEGRWGTMVAFDPPEMTAVPLEAALASMKTVPVECDTVRTARELGISFGD